MALNLKYQTAAEFAARYWAKVREAYTSGKKVRFCYLMYWLSVHIANGDITNTQARNSFNVAFNRNLDAAQWTTLVNTRFIPARDRWIAMQNEGEL